MTIPKMNRFLAIVLQATFLPFCGPFPFGGVNRQKVFCVYQSHTYARTPQCKKESLLALIHRSAFVLAAGPLR